MKKTLLHIILLLVFFLHLSFFSITQVKQGWTATNLFEKRFFIENLGQFDEHKQHEDAIIHYGSYSKGVHIYFTNSGIVFNHFKKTKKNKKERRLLQKWLIAQSKEKGMEITEEELEEGKGMMKAVPVYQEMQWEGMNPLVRVTVSEKVVTYFCYPEKNTHQSLKASAYKKLVYHNIYPNIDAEFYFPSDSIGIKYNYIVHPGGDPSMIREKWLGAQSEIQFNGDVLVMGKLGNFLAKQPVSFYNEDHKPVQSAYAVSKNIISYEIGGRTIKELVIDPWLVIPAFTTGSSGYDVDFDVAGNAYVYGGESVFDVLKYDPTGTFLWGYSTSLFGSGFNYYGDFAIDHNTGVSYIVNGFSGGGVPNVLKVSATGSFLAEHFGSSSMNEMWRIAFSSCTNQAVIGGGGTSGTDQICYLDTNLASLTTVNVLSTTSSYCDIALLTVDNYGSCYFLHATNGLWYSGHENHLVKSPMPTFLPMTYSNPTSFNFHEVGSVMYVTANGFNGLAVGNKSIFGYDSFTLKKAKTSTGVLVINKPINTPVTPTASSMYWGGITADACENVFIGSRDTVFQFDSLLNLVNFYPMPDSVFDVRISNAGVLYVTGGGFLSAIIPTGMVACTTPINPNLSVINSTCTVQGSATVSPTGGSAPYNIVWNTTPIQTGTSVTNLPPGIYTVTISDSSCSGNISTASFTITAGPGAFTTNIVVTNPSCNGSNNGSIVLDPNGVAPFTYVWDTLGFTDSTAIGLGAGVYNVLITDSANCINDLTIVVNEPPSLTGTTNADSLNCFGDVTSLVCLPGGGDAPYTVVWNTSLPVMNDTLPLATGGIYSITITDSNGCAFTFTDTLYEPAQLTLNLTTTDVSCDGAILGSINTNVSGGTGPYSYAWSDGDTTSNNTNLPMGIYTVTVTDDNNCSIAVSDTVHAIVFPAISFNSVVPCNDGVNGSITAVPTGGTSGAIFNYLWNTVPVQTGATANNLPAGTYVLSVQSGACTFTFLYVLTEEAVVDTLQMNGVICGANAYTTLYLPGIAQPVYTWNVSGITIPGANSNTFNIANGNINSVNSSWFYNGCRYTTTTNITEQYPVVSTSGIPNVFSPNKDMMNEIFYAFTFAPATDPGLVTYLFDEFAMQIFNRWGQLVFETNDPNKGWDGNDEGNSPVADGVYFVVIRFKALCGESTEPVIYKGTVQLVR